MKITRKQLRKLIIEMARRRSRKRKSSIRVGSVLAGLPKITSDVGVVLTQEDYNSNKNKMDMHGLQIARFNHSAPVPIYRIVNSEEFNKYIPASGGIISGGIFQPDMEAAFGASFGFDPVQLVTEFAKGRKRPHLHGQNYLIYIPDANGLVFANMELTYDKRGIRNSVGLLGGSESSPYASVYGSKLKKGVKLPYSFTIPPDMCHAAFGCQMIVNAKTVNNICYQISPSGDLTQINPTW